MRKEYDAQFERQFRGVNKLTYVCKVRCIIAQWKVCAPNPHPSHGIVEPGCLIVQVLVHADVISLTGVMRRRRVEGYVTQRIRSNGRI